MKSYIVLAGIVLIILAMIIGIVILSNNNGWGTLNGDGGTW